MAGAWPEGFKIVKVDVTYIILSRCFVIIIFMKGFLYFRHATPPTTITIRACTTRIVSHRSALSATFLCIGARGHSIVLQICIDFLCIIIAGTTTNGRFAGNEVAAVVIVVRRNRKHRRAPVADSYGTRA